MRPLQKEIIAALRVKPEIDPKEEIRTSIDFMKDYLAAHPFLKAFVLGISGGQDSTLTGRLAQLAIQEMRDETGDESYQFIAVRLPYGIQFDEHDAQAALDFISPDQKLVVNIKEMADAALDALEEAGLTITDFNKGNIKARQRMIVQFAIAGDSSGAVLGTDHAAESVTGFFTKFGDGAADLLPIWRLNKRQGRQLLQELGAPDEVALGVTYEMIDAYLEGKEIPEKDAEVIEGWYTKTEHKRHLPITVYDSFWKEA
jgi:NAD+ synthase